jgi:rubrerythrin
MEMEAMLNRCEHLEQRAAAVYRSFAAGCRDSPAACALWTSMARDEEEHARSIAVLRTRVAPPVVEGTRLDGWGEALAEVEARLGAAERVGAHAPIASQLAAALEVELSALEAARHAVFEATDAPAPDDQAGHAERLAAAAERLTQDPQVRLQVALLRTRARLKAV